MTFSKVVSGMGGAPSGLLKSGTNIASKSGKDWVSYGGRRAALDPNLTFWAPLNRDTQDDLGAADTFTRASDGLYLPYNGADWRIAGTNAPRHEDGKLLMEPAVTNKCTNYNVNPDSALTNIDKIGDAASVVRRVLDVSELEAAGLSGICSTGYVLELDNSLGVTEAALQFGGDSGNTNVHSGSAWCRYVSGSGQADLRLNDNAFITPFTHTNFQRVSGSGTPSLTNIKLRLQCAAGVVARIVVNQFEELPVITSPIITLGAAGQRAADRVDWDATASVEDAQGMIGFVFNPRFERNSVPAGSLSRPEFFTLRTDTRSYVYWERTAGDVSAIRLRDSVSNFQSVIMGSDPVSGVDYPVFVRWNGVVAQVGYRSDSGWVWGVEDPFGGWAATDLFMLCKDLPYSIRDFEVYNEDRGTSWIEANYP